MNSKHSCIATMLLAVTVGAASANAAVTTVLIDGTAAGGYLNNGSFESGVSANIDVWTPGFNVSAEQRLQSNASDGTWSATIGKEGTPTYGVVQNTGYNAQAGDVFNLSFDWAAALNWDLADQIAWSLFTTATDTTAGAVTIIASGTVTGDTGTPPTYQPTVALSSIGTVSVGSIGRDVWIQFYSPTADGGSGGEFARLDKVNLSVVSVPTPSASAAGLVMFGVIASRRRRK